MEESALIPTTPYMLPGYLLYIAISVGLTVWVARTLFRNGRVFIVDSVNGNTELADSINHLLVVGFYLVNIGYVALALSTTARPTTPEGMLELLSTKVGWVLVVLGCMHFFNLYVLSRLRRRSQIAKAPPPVMPTEYVARGTR